MALTIIIGLILVHSIFRKFAMIQNDIHTDIDIISKALEWAKKYGVDSFPVEAFKDDRRYLRRVGESLSVNCAVAAYGESQVGKSYLMNSLLSTSDTPFVIANDGKNYSFIDEINPSGGKNTKVESTGIVTRFTIKSDVNERMKDYVKVNNLSVVDIILLLTDSYYNDVKINLDTSLNAEEIRQKLTDLKGTFSSCDNKQNIITEDDIKDIEDYLREVIGNNSKTVLDSGFTKIAATFIQNVPYTNWVDVFGLLWNNNVELNRLFSTLINEYRRLNFQTTVYVPFIAVLASKGTILKIDWLDTVCGIDLDNGKDDAFTDVFDAEGNLIASQFGKGYLSALIAELTFVLPQSIAKERKFLEKIDLLDFPGARSREKFKEDQIKSVLPKILRRGKVAYLFNKYSRSLQISAVLFCHHNDQKAEPAIGETINSWINQTIGKTPEERTRFLKTTNGISPLFFIATKFNLDMQKEKMDSSKTSSDLSSHWKRFDTVIPEIIKPNSWMDDWVVPGGLFKSKYFQNIFLLRDFYWSGKNLLFDGFSDGAIKSPETSVHAFPEYPTYWEDLKQSFLHHPFVQRHFDDPEKAWENVATLNNDGSKAIIKKLNGIAPYLDDARRARYTQKLKCINDDIHRRLDAYHESDNKEENNKKVKHIASDIKLSLELSVGNNAEAFGKIIDSLMIPSDPIREIAYSILNLHTEIPKDFSAVNFIRVQAGVNLDDDKEKNIARLCEHFTCDEPRLKEVLAKQGFTIDDVILQPSEDLGSEAAILSKRILEYWDDFLNSQVNKLDALLPHPSELVLTFQKLGRALNVRKHITDKVNEYIKMFDEENLPNAVADYASLLLNRFISDVGRDMMTDVELHNIGAKAHSCGLDVDLSEMASTTSYKKRPIEEVLSVLDESAELLKESNVNKSALEKLPLWSNFMKWENCVIMGLLYASDISDVNPVANKEMGEMMEACEKLYNE